MKQTIRELLQEWKIDSSEIAAIGISCGGPLDQTAGVIQAPPNLATWIDVPITSILREEFAVDCNLENDADAGAVAEHRFGAGQGLSNMVFLTMGTGLGAGMILNGHLYRGTSGHAGEIGHVRLTPAGPVGYYKAGSIEGWAGGGGIAQIAGQMTAKAMERGETTALASRYRDHGSLTARDVAEAAFHGDELAAQILNNAGHRLGEALAILIDLLNPERIVIGGLAMRLGERILAPARETMHQEALQPSAKICQVVPAALGERIGDVAAICVAMGL